MNRLKCFTGSHCVYRNLISMNTNFRPTTSQNASKNSAKQLLLPFPAVTSKRPGRSEFAQLVADHFLRHEDFHVNLAVMDEKSVTDELGDDRTRPRPSLDGVFFIEFVQFLDLCIQLGVDERPFFQ